MGLLVKPKKIYVNSIDNITRTQMTQRGGGC